MEFTLRSFTRTTCVLFLTLLFSVANQVNAHPKRDHLTRQEADMMRDTQELDKRIVLLIKAADRRLSAITNSAPSRTPPAELEALGEIKGTRADFLYDLSMILDEAITNIDDVSGRDESNPLIPKAIRKLAEASSRFLTQLEPLRNTVADGAERRSLEVAMDNAASIVEAAGKLPPPAKSNKKRSDD